MDGNFQGVEKKLTGIELFSTIRKATAVVHGDLVAVLGLAFAVDGQGYVYFELCSGNEADGG